MVFEAVGTADALETCLDAVRPGGEIVVVGNSTTPAIPFNFNALVLNEVRLSGSVSCTLREFEEATGLIATGFIEPGRFVIGVIGLAGLQAAMERQSASPACSRQWCGHKKPQQWALRALRP